MKVKAIIAGVVVLAVLLLMVLLLTVHRQPPQPITVRHVKSVQSSNLITMTFEVRNHTAGPCYFHPFKIQVRQGDHWVEFPVPDLGASVSGGPINPRGVATATVNVTNVPANSVVRICICSHRMPLGVEGFFERVKINLKELGGGHRWISLNPYDKYGLVSGEPTIVVSQEWVEAAK